MAAGWVLALSLLSAPRFTIDDGARVDAAAVERGVDARLGAAGDPWDVTIELDDGGVRILARAPGRALVEQSVSLPPEGSVEERSIIVAANVAFALEAAPIVEENPAPAEDAESSTTATDPAENVTSVPSWWVAVQGSFGVGGGPADPAGGIALDLGRWLGARRHVRASISMGWLHARRAPLEVHAVRPVAQVDAGTALREDMWVGAGVGLGGVGGWALDRETANGWALTVHVPVTVEVVLAGPLVFRGSAGLDLQTPSLRFRGAESSIRWGTLRPFVAVALGARFG